MRRFTHHALQTPIARPLNDWLSKAGPVSALMQTARELASLEAEVLALLPRGMQDGIAVAGVRSDPREPRQGPVLLLLAAHGAAAARVRQVVPTLLARLQERGSPVAAIRVRVQPDINRQGDWDMPAVRKPHTSQLGPTGLASMTELAQNLEDSPLREAVQALLARRRR